LGLAFSAAGSFRRERQCGALELILVTPLTIGQIVFGRLRGLWSQFVPAILLLSLLWVFLFAIGSFDLWPGHYDSENSLNPAFAMLALAGFFAIPIVGLYFSLRQRHFLTAWLLTLGVCLVLPCVILTPSILLGISIYSPFPSNTGQHEMGLGSAFAWAALLQLLFGSIAGGLLCDNLRRRKFALAS
jgi:ABC-type transport system involved in multi-copper enzyme maturation permease subunit